MVEIESPGRGLQWDHRVYRHAGLHRPYHPVLGRRNDPPRICQTHRSIALHPVRPLLKVIIYQ